jgi:RNA polymerase sigma-70 factor, ECF subfamily
MPNDFELIQQTRNGQRLAFRDLVRRYQKTAFYFAYNLTGDHHDAEDLSQDVFIQIFHSLDTFRGDSQFSTWLYRITLHTWSNNRRKRNSKLKALMDPMEDAILNDRSNYGEELPDQATDKSILYEHIQEATKKLSPKEKSVFVLRQFQDEKLENIAEIMNIKIGTVKSLLFRALKKMQQELAFYQTDVERTP